MFYKNNYAFSKFWRRICLGQWWCTKELKWSDGTEKSCFLSLKSPMKAWVVCTSTGIPTHQMIFLGSPKFNSVILSCRPKSFKSPFASWDFLLLYVYLTPSLPWVTRENFSSPNQYNIKQTSDDNKEKYPLGEYKLIHYQIHRPSIIKNLWQTVRRNTHVILGVKGSIQWCRFHQMFIVTLL